MVNLRASERQKPAAAEIDTRAPFQSVKAALSLFAEVKTKDEKPVIRKTKQVSSEDVLGKETQLQLAQMELERTKNKLESAETTRAQAVRDLERAKRTLQELTTKFNSVNESKELALKAAEAVKQKAELLEHAKSEKHLINDTQSQALIQARQEYMTAATQLDYAKQELNNIRQDFGAALEAKLAACQQAAEAQHSAELSSERVDELEEINSSKSKADRKLEANLKAIEEINTAIEIALISGETAGTSLPRHSRILNQIHV